MTEIAQNQGLKKPNQINGLGLIYFMILIHGNGKLVILDQACYVYNF